MAAASRRFFLGNPPFKYLAAHLAQESDFLDDAHAILNLDEDKYLRLATQLSKSDAFLSRSDITKIVEESLGEESGRIAAIVNRIAGVIHDSGMEASDAMSEFSKAIEDKAEGLDPNQRLALADRLRRLVAEPVAIAKQFKARQLADAIGAELDDFRIVCDIRPVFDQKRERIDGAIPIAILSLEYETPDGDSSVIELRVTEKQIGQLAEKLTDAKLKLTMIKGFLTSHSVIIPKTKATFAEDES
jgi:hypothetical protein